MVYKDVKTKQMFKDKLGKVPATLSDMYKEYDKKGNFKYKLIFRKLEEAQKQ